MNYGPWTGYNLLPKDADGITSPDIVLGVHKAKSKLIYFKLILQEMRIYGSRKVVPYPGTERTKLRYVAAPKPGAHTWFPKLLSANWRP